MQKQNQKQNQNEKLNIKSILYAHIIISIVLIYIIFNIPYIRRDINDPIDITNLDNFSSTELFNIYYVNNKFKSLLVDFFMIYFILKMSDYIPQVVPSILRRTVVIIIFDVLLTFYINRTPLNMGTINFLKVWIVKAGWLAIIWDIIYINLTGELASRINKFDIIKQPKYQLLIMGLIMFVFLHL
jgi:hypothetical protein